MAKQTDFAEIGNRINKYIDLKNINSRAEYQRAIKKVFEDTSFSETLLKYTDNFYEETDAQEIIEANASALTASQADETRTKAIRFERARGRGGVLDEKTTAKDNRLITPLNYRQWRNDPARLDLRGIDTRRPRGKGFATIKPNRVETINSPAERGVKRRNRGKSAKFFKGKR